MAVAAAPVEDRTRVSARWMSRIELLSYSRRTPVMLDAPDQTVPRESSRYGSLRPDWRIRANCRVVKASFPVKTHSSFLHFHSRLQITSLNLFYCSTCIDTSPFLTHFSTIICNNAYLAYLA